MVFAGHDLIAENGTLLAETSPFEGGWAETELDCQRMESERARNTSFEPSTDGYQTALLGAQNSPEVRAELGTPIEAGFMPTGNVNVTNDSWFGSFAGPQQHLAQARMRAVEQGLPLARVAQTGISAMIDPAGRITGQIPLHTAGALDVALPAPLPPTPYARWMDGPLHALLALALLVLLIDRRRRAG